MKRTREVFIAGVRALGELLFLYGLLGWGYGVLVQFTHPNWLPQLSHLTGTLRVDTFAIACFILSAVGFFLWRLTERLSKQSDEGN
jgi:uncharacterized protein with PQ loop repeat